MLTPAMSGCQPVRTLLVEVVREARRQSAAMEATAKGNQIGASGGLTGQPHGGFDGFAAGIGKGHRIESFGQVLIELCPSVPACWGG